jgi:hypothetical protein
MKITHLLFGFLLIGITSCTSYEDKQYGPVEFETSFEGGDDMLFEGMNIEAMSTIKFNPEDYGFSKESVGGMRLDNITIKTDNAFKLGVLENLKVEVSSKDTDMLTIGVLNAVPDSAEVSFSGLEEAKIENFKSVDEFYLIISGNLKEELDEPFTISGEFTMNIESSEE